MLQTEATHEMRLTPLRRWRLCVYVIPSEYRTKEITSALLGLITACDRKNTDYIGSARTEHEAVYVSACIIHNKSRGTHRIL